jgi:hypothetical protein
MTYDGVRGSFQWVEAPSGESALKFSCVQASLEYISHLRWDEDQQRNYVPSDILQKFLQPPRPKTFPYLRRKPSILRSQPPRRSPPSQRGSAVQARGQPHRTIYDDASEPDCDLEFVDLSFQGYFDEVDEAERREKLRALEISEWEALRARSRLLVQTIKLIATAAALEGQRRLERRAQAAPASTPRHHSFHIVHHAGLFNDPELDSVRYFEHGRRGKPMFGVQCSSLFAALQAQLQHSRQIAERTTSGRPYHRHRHGQGRTWRPPKAQAQLFPPPGTPPASLSPRQAPFLQWQPVTSGNHDVDLDTLDRHVCQAAVCIQRAVRGRLLSRSNAGSRFASAPQIPVADPAGEPRTDIIAPPKVPTVDSASLAPDESDDAASAASTTPAGDMSLLPWIGLLLFSQWTRLGRRSRIPRCSGSRYQPQTAPPYHNENPASYDNTVIPGLWPRPRLTRRQCCNYSRGKPKPNCSINHGCTDGTGPRPSFEPV